MAFLPIGILVRSLVSRVQFQRGWHAPSSTKSGINPGTQRPHHPNGQSHTKTSQLPTACKTGMEPFETPSNACSNLLRSGDAIDRPDRVAEIHASSSIPTAALTFDRRCMQHHLMRPPSPRRIGGGQVAPRLGTPPLGSITDARRDVTGCACVLPMKPSQVVGECELFLRMEARAERKWNKMERRHATDPTGPCCPSCPNGNQTA